MGNLKRSVYTNNFPFCVISSSGFQAGFPFPSIHNNFISLNVLEREKKHPVLIQNILFTDSPLVKEQSPPITTLPHLTTNTVTPPMVRKDVSNYHSAPVKPNLTNSELGII